MKTISKNLKILKLALSLGSLTLLGVACTGSGVGSQELQLPLTAAAPAAVEQEAPVAASNPVNVPEPTPAPVTCYKYAFTSNRNGGFQNVFLSDTCSNQPQPLTANEESRVRFESIAFRPDGAQMVFDRKIASFQQVVSTTILANLPSSPEQFLTTSEIGSDDLGGLNGEFFPGDVTWDSTGSRFAFIATTPLPAAPGPNPPLVFPTSLKIFDTVGNIAREIFPNVDTNVNISSPLWHPDNQKVFFVKREFLQPATLNSFNLETGRTNSLLEQVNGSFALGAMVGDLPAFRPDGQELAFVRSDGLREQIFTCTLDKFQRFGTLIDFCRDARPLTSQGSNSHPSYTPDGQFILFTSDRDGNREIYKMKADGSELIRLTENSLSDEAPVVHPVSFQVPGN